MTPTSSRRMNTLAAAAVTTLLAGGALAAPAQADRPGPGDYAASIATTATPGVTLAEGPIATSTIKSTSSTVSRLHGVLYIKVYRISTGEILVKKFINVGGPSGSTYKVSIPGTISGRWYRVVTKFYATAGHVEKRSSFQYISFKR